MQSAQIHQTSNILKLVLFVSLICHRMFPQWNHPTQGILAVLQRSAPSAPSASATCATKELLQELCGLLAMQLGESWDHGAHGAHGSGPFKAIQGHSCWHWKVLTKHFSWVLWCFMMFYVYWMECKDHVYWPCTYGLWNHWYRFTGTARIKSERHRSREGRLSPYKISGLIFSPIISSLSISVAVRLLRFQLVKVRPACKHFFRW